MPYSLTRFSIGGLLERVDSSALEWLEQRRAAIQAGADDRSLIIAFGQAARKVGRADLSLSADAIDQASEARPGWRPHAWTIDQAARALLILAIPSEEPAPGSRAWTGSSMPVMSPNYWRCIERSR